MQILFSGLFCVLTATFGHALTSEEAQLFINSEAYGGYVTVNDVGDYFNIVSNGIPDHGHVTENRYIPVPQNYNYKFSKAPREADTPGCLGGGLIEISRTGVAIYNPLLETSVENAVDGPGAESMDDCGGHTNDKGRYHYHSLLKCFYKGTEDEFIGVAMDGFPIYGPKASFKSDGEVTTADLDQCHGKKVGTEYRYYATNDFPYTVGCYRGVNATINQVQTEYTCTNTSSFSEPGWGYICLCQMNGAGSGHQANSQQPAQLSKRQQTAQQPDSQQPGRKPSRRRSFDSDLLRRILLKYMQNKED